MLEELPQATKETCNTILTAVRDNVTLTYNTALNTSATPNRNKFKILLKASFFGQRIRIAIQDGNAVSLPGTSPDDSDAKEYFEA